MVKRISEDMKIDVGLVSQALNNSNVTGRYFDMSKYRKALAVLIGGAMAAGTTSKVEFLQASDANGTGSKVIAGAAATITANANVTAAQVVVGTPANGETVTVNGIVFTKASATNTANREFADAAGLETCINDETYGVPGVTATNNAGTVSLVATDPGETTITLSSSDAVNLTCSTIQAVAYVEISASQLDLTNDFTHVAAKVTTTANTNVAVVLLRGNARFSPSQKVAASAVI
ncbi:MAG: hypothetical protein H0Z35_12410 [Thermoanaerobacteraceae bacterium]|nr:hypothetical protein [Thermoanaerobacteraceae bacterium]